MRSQCVAAIVLHLVNSINVATLSAASGTAVRHCDLFCKMLKIVFAAVTALALHRARCGRALKVLSNRGAVMRTHR